MKIRKICVWLLALALVLAGCGGGDVGRVNRVIGESSHYTREGIEQAMDVVERHFRGEFEGCTLKELVYDEEATAEEAAEWAAQYGTERAIVLISTFDVGAQSDGSLNPNSTYENWKWILTPTLTGWELKTCGYG